jgi:hypothetical protein
LSRGAPIVPVLALVLVCAACDRGTSSPSSARDSSGPRELAVRVPGALMIARGIDSVSVSIDPTSLADTTVLADAGMVIGIETECFVFPMGQARPASGRHGLTSSANFDVGVSTWNANADGIPVQGTKYVAEMEIVLFQTDVPAGHKWDPHAGRFKALWTRTLRQAEE